MGLYSLFTFGGQNTEKRNECGESTESETLGNTDQNPLNTEIRNLTSFILCKERED